MEKIFLGKFKAKRYYRISNENVNNLSSDSFYNCSVLLRRVYPENRGIWKKSYRTEMSHWPEETGMIHYF